MESLFIRRAKEKPEADRSAALREIAEDFISFWESKGKLHFREEEEILLPAYASHVDLQEDADVLRMLADHASIRARVNALASCLSAHQAVDRQITELGQILQDHVRLEENIIFPRIEKTLSESEMQQLGRRLTWLHPKGKESCEI